MTVAGETDPGGSMRAEIFARLDAHLAKSKVEVRPTRPETPQSDRSSKIARIRPRRVPCSSTTTDTSTPPPPTPFLPDAQDSLESSELYELVRVFAAFGIDGFPSDQPRDDAVRRLLETELPPETEPEVRAPPPANARRYVPQHAEAASTPKRPAYGGGRGEGEFRDFREFGDDASPEDGLARFAPTSPRERAPFAAPYALEAFESDQPTTVPLGGSARAARSASARSASAERVTAAAASRYAVRGTRTRPASASTSTSPSRARPAWGGGGGSRRLEDSESPKARKLSRRGTHHPGGFDATSRSAETALSGKERARVAASRARAELATVERLRAARELRESRQSAPGGVASARRFTSQTALAFGSSAPASRRGDAFGGASLRSSSPAYSSGAFARNAGDRLYRRGVFEREKRERERARELERIAAEAIGDVAISRDFSGGMGGVESSRPFGMTNVSRALMTDARAFESRQRLFEAKKAESIELERLRAFTRDLEETRDMGKPRITASARAMRRTVDDLGAWQRRRDARLEQARRDREADESRELTFAPATDFSRSAAAATRPVRARRAPGAWSPPKSAPRASSGAVKSPSKRGKAPRGTAGRAFAEGKEEATVRAAGTDGTVAGGGPAPIGTPTTKSAPASDADSRAAARSHVSPYSPKAHEREMARALAGAALAGAAAMARVATPAAARPSTTPLSVSSPEPPNSNPFGLTQVTRGETHDTSPSRVPGSGRSRGDAADEATPSPDPRAATSLRNSVASDASAPAGASAGPSPRRVPVATTRATELRDAARRLAREEAAAKEAFRPQITARARALRRPGDFGERLHENASAKKGGPIAKSPATATNDAGVGVARASAPSASAMPSVAGALARQKEKAREGRRAARASAPGPEKGGARGDLPAWGAYGGGDAAPASAQRRLDLRGDPSSARARRDDGPPDRGARRSVQEAEARAREAWGYYE